MIAKVALQKIRQLAKRGTNQTLTRAIEEVYLAGMEAGARALSEQLKGRINDYQIANNGANPGRERGEPDSTEPSGSLGANPDDGNSDPGSTSPTPNEPNS